VRWARYCDQLAGIFEHVLVRAFGSDLLRNREWDELNADDRWPAGAPLMSLMANPAIVRLRSFARRVGINRLLGGLLGKPGYEARLAAALRDSIRDGDCVWDVGANIGWYTLQFGQWVGPRGQVIAFEPARFNVSRLREAVAEHANVTVCPLGLSNQDRAAEYRRGSDELGATGMIIADADADARIETVTLLRGDAVIQGGNAQLPDLVKIDVEGHELEVLEGMAGMLEQPRLKHIFIEMHFAVLEEQGRGQVPSTIESLLRSKGFSIQWVDPSHLHASR
jgi:FkbM family methyltransferase